MAIIKRVFMQTLEPVMRMKVRMGMIKGKGGEAGVGGANVVVMMKSLLLSLVGADVKARRDHGQDAQGAMIVCVRGRS
eukprot:51899-Eustigmatos_ZCMA.PRE.1